LQHEAVIQLDLTSDLTMSLTTCLLDCLTHKEKSQQLGTNAKQLMQQHGGVTDKIYQLLLDDKSLS